MTESRESTTSGRPGRTSGADSSELMQANVKRIAGLEEAEHAKATPGERVADAIAAFTGSMWFVWISVALIGGWVVINLVLPQGKRLDPFPFPLLTLMLSVEAIFLSAFVLMTQNRMARDADRHAQLDLQISLLTEHELTRVLRVLTSLAAHLDVKEAHDPSNAELAAEVDPTAVLDAIERESDDQKT